MQCGRLTRRHACPFAAFPLQPVQFFILSGTALARTYSRLIIDVLIFLCSASTFDIWITVYL